MTPRAALAALLIASLGTACGGDGGSEPSSTKGPDPFDVPANIQTEQRRKAAPRWEDVASFSGSGADTGSFSIVEGAIQWRATYKCSTGRLQLIAVPAPRDGQPVADTKCPARGQGFGLSTGDVALRVEASGPWDVDIEQQVDTPIFERPLAGMASQAIIERGRFHGIERGGKGEALLYRLPGGRLALRLQSFRTSPNNGLFVWLSEAPNPRTTKQVFARPHVDIGELKSTRGDHNYLLPSSVTEDQVHSIVIWCAPIRIAYTAASLKS